MFIPDRLYKRLPLLYAGAGVGSWLVFGLGFPIVLSTVSLFAASLLTFIWRRNHRMRVRRQGVRQASSSESLSVRQRR